MNHALPACARVARAHVRAGLLIAAFATAAPVTARAQSTERELDRLVAELLPRVQTLSGLEARHKLNVALRTRDQLGSYIGRQLDRQVESGEVAHAERAYRLLGLLPDSVDLAALSAALLGDAVQGYYDAETDTLFVLDDVSASELRPVLAHEMVHALQDQHYPLDSLRAGEPGNDRLMAIGAAVEGHATLVMLLVAVDALKGSPATLEDLPDLTRLPLEALMPGSPAPSYASAPRVMRESGAFVYGRGAGFAHALRTRDATAIPFGPLLPTSTEQVMNPHRRFLDARDEPTAIHFDSITAAEPGWETVYENTLGQFELSILLMERHRLQSESIADGWDGDRYRLLTDGTHDVLEWALVWDDARAASRFVTTYRQILRTRLGRSAQVEQLTVDGRPLVLVIEAEDGVDLSTLPRLRVHLTGGEPATHLRNE